MQDHTVRVDGSTTPATLTFAPNFNVAVPFIDRHLAEGRAAKIAVRSLEGEATYGQLAENVGHYGNALKVLGIGPGDRVLMVVKDCPAFLYLFWGAIKAGIVPVPLNTLLRAHDYAYMIEDSGCKGVFYSKEFAGDVESGLQQAGLRPEFVMTMDTLAERAAAVSDALAPHPATATDDCFWLYSSGTTGRPKGAVHSHRDMVVTSQLYGTDVLGVREDDTVFSAAKLFFAYGLGNAMTFPLWMGASAVLFPARPTPETTFETIERFRPTLFFGVPTLYAAQLKAMEHKMPDLSSLRVCVSAGEALPADILKRWRERTGTDILDGIGSTEALHIFISNRPGDIKPGTSGRPVPGYDARIVDEQGREKAAGESGTLFIRGDSTAKFYWNNAERTEKTMVDGWLNTGDTYSKDEDGYFHYGGRSDDMLKVGGIWCSPFEIEARLVEHPKVLEAAVVGHGDDQGLIKPEAWIVLNDPGDAGETMAGALLEHCKAGLAPYKYPRWFHFVDELPKTATGKIQRFRLREG